MEKEYYQEDWVSEPPSLPPVRMPLKYWGTNEEVSQVVRKIKNGTAKDLLYVLLPMMAQKSNMVRCTPDFRKKLCDEFEIKKSTLSLAFKALREHDLLKGKTDLMINPYYFWKCRLENRCQLIAMYNKYDDKKQDNE